MYVSFPTLSFICWFREVFIGKKNEGDTNLVTDKVLVPELPEQDVKYDHKKVSLGDLLNRETENRLDRYRYVFLTHEVPY